MHKPVPGDELRKVVKGWVEKDVVGQMGVAVTEADDKLAGFVATMDSPILRRTEWSIGQDILIKWIISLAPESARNPSDVSGKKLDAIDDTESVLAKWGVLAGPVHLDGGLGPVAEGTRLGVDFGAWWTSRDDQKDAFQAAVAEKRRMDQLGRLGVIVRPDFVRLQHNAYLVTGRPDPKGGEPEWLFACRGSNPDYTPLRVGQVVVVSGTELRWLDVEPVTGSPDIPYGPLQLHPRSARWLEKQREEERRKQLAARIDYGPVTLPEDELERLERLGFDRAEARYLPDEVRGTFWGIPPRGQQGATAPAGASPPLPGAVTGPVSASQLDEPEEEAPVCVQPDMVDDAISPSDPLLDPDAAEVLFGSRPLASPTP